MPESRHSWLGATVLLLAAFATAGSAQPLAADLQALNLATFDKTWTLVNETYFDPTFNGVDWDQVREQLRPRAENSANSTELRQVLQEMIDRLGQSHFQILPVGPYVGSADRSPKEVQDKELPKGCAAKTQRVLARQLMPAATEPLEGATPGLDLRELGGEILVFGVDDSSAAASLGVAPGWRILRIGRTRVSSFLPCFNSFEGIGRRSTIRTWLVGLLEGPAGSSVGVTFEDGDGRRRAELLARQRRSGGEIGGFGNLPPTRVRFDVAWTTTAARLRVPVVTFNVWLLPVIRDFDAAMGELREADGIIIDLRGNPGGIAALTQGIAGHFLDQRLSLGTMKSRTDDLRLVVNPRRVSSDGRRVQPYAGPLAILTDEMTASTSEVFAAGLQDLGRAHLVGQPSAGAALPSLVERLPNGDVFLHATMDFIRPNGERVEGRPVIPDTPTRTTRSDLLAGRDPALIAALEWIEASSGNDADHSLR